MTTPSPADIAVYIDWIDERLKNLERSCKLRAPPRPETPSESIRRKKEAQLPKHIREYGDALEANYGLGKARQ